MKGIIVDHILSESGRASGVSVQVDEAVQEIKVRREVIASAGMLQSPAILMRSGIGPGAALQAQGLDVRVDAAGVGANLQDHSGVMIGKLVNVPIYNSEMDPLDGSRHLLNYLLLRRGPLASAAVQAMAWARSDAAMAEPDIHLNFFPYGVDFNARPPAMHKLPCVNIGSCISRPHSRGVVRLRDADPEASHHRSPNARRWVRPHDDDPIGRADGAHGLPPRGDPVSMLVHGDL